jgi:hypothetical protein
MPKIGRQIPHFDRVDINSISAVFSDDKFYRYVLTMSYLPDLMQQERSESLAVILKNPSSADEKASDATIRKVETFVFQRFPNVKYLTILNLFAIRATFAKEVQQNLKLHDANFITGPENQKWFKKILRNSNHVICAWGGPSGIDKTVYSNRINEVKGIFTNGNFEAKLWRVEGAQKTTEPLHGLMWGYEYRLMKIG